MGRIMLSRTSTVAPINDEHVRSPVAGQRPTYKLWRSRSIHLKTETGSLNVMVCLSTGQGDVRLSLADAKCERMVRIMIFD